MPTDSPEALPFFEKRGYSAEYETYNMVLMLDSFAIETLGIPPKLADIELRLAEAADRESLLRAVQEVDPSWVWIFEHCVDPIVVAMRSEEVVGFAILSPAGGRFARPDQQMGSIGCVGVVRATRKRGIGLQMVAFGADWLKSRGCSWVELLYLVLVDWYARIGFTVSSRQWMGSKQLRRT